MERLPNPDMFILARESRGLTQVQLSNAMGVSQALVSRVEKGLLAPSNDLMNSFAEHLRYPKTFFLIPGHRYPPATPFHRKKKSISKRVQSMVEAEANVRRLNIIKLLDAIEFTDSKVVHLDLDDYSGNPELVAQAVRRSWRLPRGPIQNMTKTLEDAGIIVIATSFGTSLLDGFTLLTANAPPLIFVNADMPSDRIRYTLGHELGHITMHTTPTLTMEDEANLFASEFLMPGDEIAPYLNNTNLATLASLKPYWKASMAAILMRASSLKKLTYNQQRYLWSQMNKHGYMTREPIQLDNPVEQPTLLKEILDLHLNGLGYTTAELSEMLCIHEEEFLQWYFPQKVRLRVVKQSWRSLTE